MKKAVFIILLALPVFLMVTISVAGRLIILYAHIPVERVLFADENGEEITTLRVAAGETIVIKATVLPEEATNKKVLYSWRADEGLEFDYDETTGEFIGHSHGTARLKAITDDKKLQAELMVMVRDEGVSGISLNKQSHELKVGENFKLVATISPASAQNRDVIWSSADESLVSVGQDGTILALAVTDEPISITATTVDGGFTAECLVTVVEGFPPLAFLRSDGTLASSSFNVVVSSNQIDLTDYLYYDDELIDFDEIRFSKTSSGGTLEGHILTFDRKDQSLTLRAYVERDGALIYEYFATFRY